MLRSVSYLRMASLKPDMQMSFSCSGVMSVSNLGNIPSRNFSEKFNSETFLAAFYKVLLWNHKSTKSLESSEHEQEDKPQCIIFDISISINCFTLADNTKGKEHHRLVAVRAQNGGLVFVGHSIWEEVPKFPFCLSFFLSTFTAQLLCGQRQFFVHKLKQVLPMH